MPPKKSEVIAARRQDYSEVFATDTGQRVLRDLMRECFMFSPTFSERDEGQRMTVLYILGNIEDYDLGAAKFLEQSRVAAIEAQFNPLELP